jgi:benzoyl-CoA reductase/2-hydroxyglutaryl-CoA dehydratase subunit BcrC/BadD/HgdB
MPDLLKSELPSIFSSFAEARQNGFLAVKKLKEAGVGVVGTFCTYTPVEVFWAAGLVQVGLCSTSDETIPEAEKSLPRNLCPLIKASYGFAVTDKCPYMYFSDLVVGETTCDGKKKMYELLGEIKDVYVMELPHSQTSKEAKAFWLAEIRKLKERVEAKFHKTITDANLIRAIGERNSERKALKTFYELSTHKPPPMTGLAQLQILFGSQFKFSHVAKMADILGAITKIVSAYEAGERPVSEKAKRLVVTGCPMGGATEKLTKAIEESNGVVVAYENCTGAKQFDRLIPEEGDPWVNLAEHYLAIGCAVMSPNPNRLELLGRLCQTFQADGVIEMTLTACQPYAVESRAIGQFLAQKNLPFLTVETDYSQGDFELLKTRVGAFIENLA